MPSPGHSYPVTARLETDSWLSVQVKWAPPIFKVGELILRMEIRQEGGVYYRPLTLQGPGLGVPWG